jgi:hypothetical protein
MLKSAFVTVNRVIADWIIRAGNIRVERGDFYGTRRYPDVQDGNILVEHAWEHMPADSAR